MHLVLMGGSLRPESLNGKFLRHLQGVLTDQGHRVTSFVGAAALRLPLYEDGLETPAAVRAMAEALRDAQGLVVVSPEYNAGIPGHLKNAVDWLSVQQPSPMAGLPVLLCACSPGALGGARGLVPWRLTLANMGAFVVPEAVTVPKADQNLGADGAPGDGRTREFVRSALGSFLTVAARVKPAAM